MRLSSTSTRFYKRVFPLLFFGMCASLVVGTLLSRPFDPWLLVLFGGMALLGFFVLRAVVRPLADEVFDEGDELLVRRGELKERVALSNIMNVSVSNQRPPRVTLRLVTPGVFGAWIVFLPERTGPSLDGRDSVVDALVERIHRARARASH